MAGTIRKSGMKEVPLSEIKDDLSRFLREAQSFKYRLEHNPRFLQRIDQARNSLRAGRGTRLEDL
jgi:hypothetical protein